MTNLEAVQVAIETVNQRHSYGIEGHDETRQYQAAIEAAVAEIAPDLAVRFHSSPVRGGWLGRIEGEGKVLYFAPDAVAILNR